VGVHMIVGALRGRDEATPTTVDWRTLFALAFATSIDAVAAGVTLPLLDAPPAIALGLLGVVTFTMTLAGARAGVAIGSRFGQILEVVGGLAIVAIGVRVLAEHL
jgi:manganese efflux pump family protein